MVMVGNMMVGDGYCGGSFGGVGVVVGVRNSDSGGGHGGCYSCDEN